MGRSQNQERVYPLFWPTWDQHPLHVGTLTTTNPCHRTVRISIDRQTYHYSIYNYFERTTLLDSCNVRYLMIWGQSSFSCTVGKKNSAGPKQAAPKSSRQLMPLRAFWQKNSFCIFWTVLELSTTTTFYRLWERRCQKTTISDQLFTVATRGIGESISILSLPWCIHAWGHGSEVGPQGIQNFGKKTYITYHKLT